MGGNWWIVDMWLRLCVLFSVGFILSYADCSPFLLENNSNLTEDSEQSHVLPSVSDIKRVLDESRLKNTLSGQCPWMDAGAGGPIAETTKALSIHSVPPPSRGHDIASRAWQRFRSYCPKIYYSFLIYYYYLFLLLLFHCRSDIALHKVDQRAYDRHVFWRARQVSFLVLQI